MHSHTYSGNPLGCACGLAVQKIFKEQNILQNAQKNAEYLHSELSKRLGNHKNVGEIRHIGLINAIELVQNKSTKEEFPSSIRLGYQIYQKALKRGLLLRPLGNVLYFNPPLIISPNEIDIAIDRCAKSIEDVLGR